MLKAGYGTRYLAMASTKLYVERMLSYVPDEITVEDLFNVHSYFEDLDESEERPKALFALEVKKQEETQEVVIRQFKEPDKEEVERLALALVVTFEVSNCRKPVNFGC